MFLPQVLKPVNQTKNQEPLGTVVPPEVRRNTHASCFIVLLKKKGTGTKRKKVCVQDMSKITVLLSL